MRNTSKDAAMKKPYLYMVLRNAMSFMLNKNEPHKRLLKNIIIKECPELELDSTTDYERVCILRRWAAQKINCATYSLLFDIRRPEFNLLSAYEIYQLFNNNIGGVWCGGANNFLRKIYKSFDFRAYNLNYGTPDAFTHVSTLVVVQCDKQNVMSIQDAYFDITYEYQNGKPIDYFSMLKLLKERRDSEISTVEPQPPLMRDFYIYSGDIWTNLNGCTDVKEIDHDCLGVDRITKVHCKFNSDFALAAFLDRINIFLSNNGLPSNLLYLNLFPIAISDDFQGKLLVDARKITGWPPVIDN
jgi:hypothetical protein